MAPMNKLATGLLFFCFCIITGVNAQLRTAITGGVQLSSIPGQANPGWDTLIHQSSARKGFNIGIIAETPFFNSHRLYFLTGMKYVNKGQHFFSSYDTSSTIRSVKGRHFVNYMEVPVNLVFKSSIGANSKLVMGAGPYVSFLFSGREATQTTFSNGQVVVSENTSLKLPRSEAKYRNVDAGVNAFAGLEFGKFFMNANFSRAFTDFYQPVSGASPFKHQTVGVAIGVYLSSEKKRVSKLKDRDNDNVPDRQDECPREKGSALSKGCPDKDGDGVADKNDFCPNLAGPAARNGCPPSDTDKDGVNDDEDKCPNEKGTKENNGCPEEMENLKGTFESYARRVQFRYKSAELTESSKEVLDKIVKILKRNRSLNVLIEGYTSKDGRNHLRISQSRAESVKKYFEENGISPRRLKAVGFGAANPVNEQRTEAERALNRRVELKVTQ